MLLKRIIQENYTFVEESFAEGVLTIYTLVWRTWLYKYNLLAKFQSSALILSIEKGRKSSKFQRQLIVKCLMYSAFSADLLVGSTVNEEEFYLGKIWEPIFSNNTAGEMDANRERHVSNNTAIVHEKVKTLFSLN